MQKRQFKPFGMILILLITLIVASTSVWAESIATPIGVQYRAHIQNEGNMPKPEGSFVTGSDAIGTTGKSLRLEGVWIELTGEVPEGASINYQIHVANKGWLDPVKNGDFAGTTGLGLQVEAIKIWLSDFPGYDVYYRGHVQNKGDTPIENGQWGWVKNGEELGTTGLGLRLEELEIKIVPQEKPTKPLSAPTDLTATVSGAHALRLTWSAPENAESYAVYQSDSANGPYSQIASAVTDTTFAVDTLASGQTYYFKVAAAANGFTSSDLSTEVSAIADIDRQGTIYFGSSLLIVNTSLDFTTTESTGNLPERTTIQSSEAYNSTPSEGGRIDAVVPYEPTAETQFITDHEYVQTQTAVGDMTTFYVYNFATDSSDQLDAKCVYNEGNVEIWVDNTTDENGNLAVPVKSQLSQDQIEVLGQEYNNTIYQQMIENFGVLPVVNNSNKVTILVYDIQDGYRKENKFKCGYFQPLDLTTDAQSNRRSMIYLDTYPSMTPDPETPSEKDASTSYSTIAHELQHVINYNVNVLQQGGSRMSACLDEAFSMAAEDMLYGTQYGRIEYFKSSEAVQNGLSPLIWQNGKDDDALSSYAMSYMFAMYLEAQAGTTAVFKDIIDEPGDDFSALQTVIYQDIDPSLSIVDLLTNFRIALLVSADSGPYGFGGNPDFDDVKPLSYAGEPLNLFGGGAIVTDIASSPFTDDPADQGVDIQLIGVFTPSREEIAQKNKEKVIALINEIRQTAGLIPLVEDSALDQAAAVRAEEATILFSHDRPNGESLADLLNEVGINDFTEVSEDITKGFSIPQPFLNAISQEKLMNQAYTKIGVGTYSTDKTTYWALIYRDE
ncbi:CAP domain-containing protein [Acetobacterium wieringae]|uniref:CAP domain-containing protein n=1 Tax=Acetobacterium wieringae TaxID=52694 RepID=UPI0026EBE96C|nr:CAP domain-containing protein [Acetobacterium wieringae]